MTEKETRRTPREEAHIEALLREYKSYTESGEDDRAKDVVKSLKALGYNKSPEEGSKETAVGESPLETAVEGAIRKNVVGPEAEPENPNPVVRVPESADGDLHTIESVLEEDVAERDPQVNIEDVRAQAADYAEAEAVDEALAKADLDVKPARKRAARPAAADKKTDSE